VQLGLHRSRTSGDSRVDEVGSLFELLGRHQVETLDLPPQRGRPALVGLPTASRARLDSWVAGACLIDLRDPTPRKRLRRFASGICAQRRFDVAEEIDSGLSGAREIVFV